jgi:hypothetical protein
VIYPSGDSWDRGGDAWIGEEEARCFHASFPTQLSGEKIFKKTSNHKNKNNTTKPAGLKDTREFQELRGVLLMFPRGKGAKVNASREDCCRS